MSSRKKPRLLCCDDEDGEEMETTKFGKLSDVTKSRFDAEKLRKSSSMSSESSSNNSYTPVISTPSVKVIDDDSLADASTSSEIYSDVFGAQGKRQYMEDTYTIFSDKKYHYFAIFDGHCGRRASDKAAAQLHRKLMQHASFADGTIDGTQIALTHAFLEIDREFLIEAERNNYSDGSTGLVAVIVGDHLFIAWVGDSRAVICRSGKSIRASEDHKPNRADEKARIEMVGGRIEMRGVWRVSGPTPLAVSRAFGDRLMKIPPYVIADPEQNHFQISNCDEFILMGSDGLWDVLDDQMAIDLAKEWRASHGSYTGCAQFLTEKAIALGSMDNVTAMIIVFPANDPAAAT